jgi:acyl-CoA reductase-like NAD-dependent aldehyde dehydrogenase
VELTNQSVPDVVAAAQQSVPIWQSLGFHGRKKILDAWATHLTKNIKEVAEIISNETGKPLSDARLEAIVAIEHLTWAAKNASKILATQSRPSGLLFANIRSKVERVPFGVIGVIGPWNYPMHTPMGSISYALAAGNCVVFKPSEYTPLIGRYLAESFSLFAPNNHIFSALPGDPALGVELTKANVDKIAFTGSTRTAKKVAASCAERLIPVILECGGKDPVIIAKDADIKLAANEVLWSAMANAGQSCIGAERVYVVSEKSEEFISAISQQAIKLKAGVDYGRATMPPQIQVIKSHIEDAVQKGGKFVVGSLAAIKETIVEPIIMTDVPEDSLEVRDETFGPTLVINTVSSVDEAINLANNTNYGLGAAVYSARNGEKIARKLNCGMVSINSVFIFAGIPSIPFGGVKDSGYGRIHGPEGLLEFTFAKSLIKPIFKLPFPITSFRRSKSTDKLIGALVRFLHR